MGHWRTYMEKDYLGAWDLVGPDEKPRDYTLKIVAAQSVAVKTKETPKGKRKVVLSFQGATKKFISNTTNCETIESMYGGDPKGWIGKSITLYMTDTRNPKAHVAGQPATVKCIRVRPKIPTGKAETIVERPVDEAMRAEQDAAFDRPGREPGEEG